MSQLRRSYRALASSFIVAVRHAERLARKTSAPNNNNNNNDKDHDRVDPNHHENVDVENEKRQLRDKLSNLFVHKDRFKVLVGELRRREENKDEERAALEERARRSSACSYADRGGDLLTKWRARKRRREAEADRTRQGRARTE